MKHVIVDNLRVVEIDPYPLNNEYDEECAIVRFSDASAILEAWVSRDPARRAYRWGDSAESEPCSITIAWVANDSLIMQDVDPFWSPSTDTVNGYDLGILARHLPADALKYGAEIGEEF